MDVSARGRHQSNANAFAFRVRAGRVEGGRAQGRVRGGGDRKRTAARGLINRPNRPGHTAALACTSTATVGEQLCQRGRGRRAEAVDAAWKTVGTINVDMITTGTIFIDIITIIIIIIIITSVTTNTTSTSGDEFAEGKRFVYLVVKVMQVQRGLPRFYTLQPE